MFRMFDVLCDLEVLAVLDVGEGGDAVHAEAEHLHVPQPRDDRHVRELGPPAVQLLDLVHVADPRPGHDHVLAQLHHGHAVTARPHTLAALL